MRTRRIGATETTATTHEDQERIGNLPMCQYADDPSDCPFTAKLANSDMIRCAKAPEPRKVKCWITGNPHRAVFGPPCNNRNQEEAK